MTLVDHAEPLTFGELAARFTKLGMTQEKYTRRFNLPLSYADILNPALADEIVGYRQLIAYGNKKQSRTP
jgi:hypothetical protein